MILFSSGSFSAPLDISNIPLLSGGGQEANLMFLVDNSAQMHWHHSPSNAERLYWWSPVTTRPHYENIPYRSSHINKLYYDPMIKYDPPMMAGGNSYPHANFGAAMQDGFGVEEPNPTRTRNLSIEFRDGWYAGLEDWTDCNYPGVSGGGCSTSASTGKGYTKGAQPAYYMRYDENLPGCVHAKNGKDYYLFTGTSVSGSSQLTLTKAEVVQYYKCFEKVRVGATSGGGKTGNYYYNNTSIMPYSAHPNSPYVADKDEYNHPDHRGSVSLKQRNFANWYSYYRIRINQIKTVLSHVMQKVNGNMRVGFATTGANRAPNFYWGTAADPVQCSGFGYSQNEGGNACSTFGGYSKDGSAPAYISRGVRPFKDFPDSPEVEPGAYRNQKYKSEFFKWLFAIKTAQGGNLEPAYLRRAIDAAGIYYQTSSKDGGAWAAHPGVAGSPVRACRRSYALLTTAGLHRVGNGINSWGIQNPMIHNRNVDGEAGPPVFGSNGQPIFMYQPSVPFSDNVRNTMADVAMWYWYQDLLPNEKNNVPFNPVDPASWQHMNLLALTMGSEIDVDPETVAKAAVLGEPLPNGWGYNDTNAWGNGPSLGEEAAREYVPQSFAQPDDLLHATINSRGGFYETQNPQKLIEDLTRAIEMIRSDKMIFAPTATNSGSLKNPRLNYQAEFNSDWQTNLRAYRLCTAEEAFLDYDKSDPENPVKKKTYREERSCMAEGNLWVKPSWNALDKLGNQIGNGNGGNRNIFTWDGHAGRPFVWADLSDAQKKSIGNSTDSDVSRQEIVQYIRGDRKLEGDKYRERGGKFLGDIINAALLYVGNDDFGFANAGGVSANERQSYRQRKQGNANRQEVLYAAANDGMLHAFNADDCDPLNTGGSCQGGDELFAYVPFSVIPKLDKLVAPSYKHEFYVDGSPAVGDAVLNGAWKTVLVGSTGAGGRSYFALDIENPAQFGSSSILWERSGGYKNSDVASDPKNIAPDKDFENLGVSIGQATIANMGGVWVAIFGNGYDSPGNTARLYVVRLENGERLAEIDTKTGDAANPNGLSTPIVVDENRDGIADVVYAGDLLGNLWKFNLKLHLDPSTLLPVKLLEAKDKSGKAQPITAKPEVMRHRKGGLMVYVGTGRFFDKSDKNNRDIQSFYGVRDDCGSTCETNSPAARQDLMEQSIAKQVTVIFREAKAKVGGIPETIRVITNCGAQGGEDAECSGRSGDIDKGFYLDLITGSQKLGERVTAKPIVWSDRVIFNTIEPSDDDCEPAGDGWMYEVDPSTGGRTDFSVYDLDNTGNFESSRMDGKVVSAKKVGMGGGITARGTNKYLGNTKGQVQKIANNPKHISRHGRQSWRQTR